MARIQQTETPSPISPQPPPRLRQQIWHGIKRSCPNCGNGRLFCGYLKVEAICSSCGQNNEQFPADDAAPYFTILIVGHIIAPFAITIAVKWPAVSAYQILAIVLPLTLILTLALLPIVKGGVIGVASHFKVVRR